MLIYGKIARLFGKNIKVLANGLTMFDSKRPCSSRFTGPSSPEIYKDAFRTCWARTSHHLSNVKIRFEGPDRAFSTSYVLAWHERPDKTTATIYGQYHDELSRETDGWRIRKRTMYMNGNDAGFTVDIHPYNRARPPDGWVPPTID